MCVHDGCHGLAPRVTPSVWRFFQGLHVMSFGVMVTDDRPGGTELLAGVLGLAPGDLDASPYTLVGNPQEIADTLRSYRERWGISYHSVMADTMEAFAPVVAELAGT